MPIPGVKTALTAIILIALAAAFAGADAATLWSLRAPRVAAGFTVGALLALSGLALQIILRNPLADPYVLGTSAGASVGAIVAILIGAAIGLGATVGALLAGALLLWLARGSLSSHQDDASARLILTGAMFSAMLGALATLLLTLTPDGQLRGAIFWLVGDLSGAQASWQGVSIAIIFIAAYAGFAPAIDRLMLGSEAAHLLGEPVRMLRAGLLVGACVATAAAVSIAGSIGFVGLVVPQALRMAGVRHTRRLSVMSALAGGALVVLADALARNAAYPLELPVGAVMSLVGAPVFVWLLARGAR